MQLNTLRTMKDHVNGSSTFIKKDSLKAIFLHRKIVDNSPEVSSLNLQDVSFFQPYL